jgi:hypothetical protein
MTALVHALVFWIVLRFASAYIPWWLFWVGGVAAIGFRFYSPASYGL